MSSAHKSLFVFNFSCLLAILSSNALSQAIGLAGKHPLNDIESGELLFNDFRCGSCHDHPLTNPLFEKKAPELSNVGARVAPAFLQQMIADPKKDHPGSTMPNVLAARSESERDEIAKAITHFLIKSSSEPFSDRPIPSEDPSKGKELFHSIGCIACHSPRDDQGTESISDGSVHLGHVGAKYSLQSLGQFLFQPLAVRASGRMPDMKLTRQESESIASYLIGNRKEHQAAWQPEEPLAALGAKYFEELRCTACHTMPAVRTPAPLKLPIENLEGGCLGPNPGKAPQFAFSDAQRKSLQSALKSRERSEDTGRQIAKTLTAFNCIACHIRDDYGGTTEDRNPYFLTTEKNIGEDGRIPPPLTLVGAKLQPAWLKKVLFDGESIRHYMTTRMPQFGEKNLHALPEWFTRTDVMEEKPLNLPNPESRNKEEREREKALRTAGRELLGDKGVYCIACHSFNGKASVVNQGIDLMTSYERLQPTWFQQFVRNPGKFRPRIVMPYAWPDGVAAHQTILDGDAQQQIEAIWYYLSLGTSAADPPGIRRVDTTLSVANTPRTYRGRSNVAGFRGIAVGFPERISYAFNAETGTLSAIWQGDFVRVDRGGQGSGTFHPIGAVHSFPQDVSFLSQFHKNANWPLKPKMTKEAPVNPDPLYPKNLGYQFQGYFFDDFEIPTFMYRCDEVKIEDRSVAIKDQDQLGLERTWKFETTSAKELWLRVLTGSWQQESNRSFRASKLRIVLPEALQNAQLVIQEGDDKTLLIHFDLPIGKSEFSIRYELNK